MDASTLASQGHFFFFFEAQPGLFKESNYYIYKLPMICSTNRK